MTHFVIWILVDSMEQTDRTLGIVKKQRILNTLCIIACYILFATPYWTAGQKILWSCDFSGSSLCGALNVTSQTYFYFGSGETASEGTGPKGDHTLERYQLQRQNAPDSEYIYLEASWARQEDKAILRLPFVPIEQESCLIFYYHMFSGSGYEQGNLKVTVSRDSVAVWLVSGSKGPYWNQGQVRLPRFTINIQFVAARGSGYQSDIALDDIIIISEACQGPPGTQTPVSLPPLPTLPPRTPAPFPTLNPSPPRRTLAPIPTFTPEPFIPPFEPVTPTPSPPFEPVTPAPSPPFEPVTPAPLPPFEPVTPAPLPPFEPVTPVPLPPFEPVTPVPLPPPEPVTPAPLPPQEPVTPASSPPQEPVTPVPVPPQEPVTPAPPLPEEPIAPTQLPPQEPLPTPSPIPPMDPVTPSSQTPLPADIPAETPAPPQPVPTLAPLPQTQTPRPTTPTSTVQTTTTRFPDTACDPRYQFCPTPTKPTLAWKISPREQFPTLAPSPIINKSTFDWDSDYRNGLGFVITQAKGGHWSEDEENGQPLISSNNPRRWLTLYSSDSSGTSSVTSKFLQTTLTRACLEYKAVLNGQAGLSVYLRQQGVPTAFKVHNHSGHPQYLGKIRLPVHNFMLTEIGFYISFKGEVTTAGDFVTIDEITLYNDDC